MALHSSKEQTVVRRNVGNSGNDTYATSGRGCRIDDAHAPRRRASVSQRCGVILMFLNILDDLPGKLAGRRGARGDGDTLLALQQFRLEIVERLHADGRAMCALLGDLHE